MKAEENPKNKPSMTTAQRWAGLYVVILMLLLLAFFLYHQFTQTGFFTDKFKWQEMIALYAPIIIAMAPPIQRAIQGKRNAARPLEAATDFSLALGSLWLWNHFPFDFAHLGDVLPATMGHAFDWINNNVGRFILLLQIVTGSISGLGMLVSYFRERKKVSSDQLIHK
jgi:hypothetical protein